MKKATVVLLMILGAALMSCSLNRGPVANYVAVEKSSQYKRKSKDWTRPNTFLWSNVAFKKNNRQLRYLLSDQQKDIIVEHGQPEYLRKFKSTRKESVSEWVFLEKDLLFQFIRRELAYEGPVTDLENILIIRGYPNDVLVQESYPTGRDRVTFIYSNRFKTALETYSFARGELIDHVYTH